MVVDIGQNYPSQSQSYGSLIPRGLATTYGTVTFVNIDSGNGLLAVPHQSITRHNADLLAERIIGTYLSNSCLTKWSFVFNKCADFDRTWCG